MENFHVLIAKVNYASTKPYKVPNRTNFPHFTRIDNLKWVDGLEISATEIENKHSRQIRANIPESEFCFNIS